MALWWLPITGEPSKIMGHRSPTFSPGNEHDASIDQQRAALHVHIRGARADSCIYENDVMLVLTFRDDLISGLYEYLDTIMVNELFCGPMDDIK